MTSQEEHPASRFLGMNRKELLVVLVIIGSLAAILIPAVQRAREAARKMQSTNNLKQISLAIHNYHATYKQLPPGAFAVSNGDGHLGWTYAIHPYIEASPLFGWIDPGSSWDSVINRQSFWKPCFPFQNPSVREVITREGFPVTHYMANPAFFHLNSSRSLDDATLGTSHAWFAGEVAGNYQPWGYPFNWRALMSPLNASTSSYGRPTGDGAIFAMADCSVRFFGNDVDRTLLATLTSHPPLPEAELIRVPERTFEVVPRSQGHRWERRELNDAGLGRLGASAFISPTGRVKFLELRDWGKGFDRGFVIDDVRTAVAWYPEAEELLIPLELDDEVSLTIASMPALVRLYVPSVNLSADGLRSLAHLQTLRLLSSLQLDQEQRNQLREVLPGCEISVHR